MTPARSLGQATRDSAVMAVCIVLVIACTGFASQGWALLISFDGRPSDTAQSGLLTMAIVAAALAVIAVIAGLIGHSWWSAGIIGAHAALTVLHPNLRLLSALPVIVALLLLARARLVAPALLGRPTMPGVDNASGRREQGPGENARMESRWLAGDHSGDWPEPSGSATASRASPGQRLLAD